MIAQEIVDRAFDLARGRIDFGKDGERILVDEIERALHALAKERDWAFKAQDTLLAQVAQDAAMKEQLRACADAAEARVKELEEALRFHKVTGHSATTTSIWRDSRNCVLCLALDAATNPTEHRT